MTKLILIDNTKPNTTFDVFDNEPGEDIIMVIAPLGFNIDDSLQKDIMKHIKGSVTSYRLSTKDVRTVFHNARLEYDDETTDLINELTTFNIRCYTNIGG